MHELADLAGLDLVVRCDVPGIKAKDLADHEQDAVGLGSLDDRVAVARREGQRLLDENVLPSVRGGHGRRHVPVIGRAYAHRRDVVPLQELLVVGVAIDLKR